METAAAAAVALHDAVAKVCKEWCADLPNAVLMEAD